jgi:iron complex transport system ATP-binding protein
VMVLHDLNLASQYADRVALLREGQMLALGSAAEVLTPSLIEQAFGTPMLSLPHPSRGTPVLVAA